MTKIELCGALIGICFVGWLSYSDSELRITFMWFAAAYGLGRGGMYIDNRFDDLEMKIDDLELRCDSQNGDAEIDRDRRIFEQYIKKDDV